MRKPFIQISRISKIERKTMADLCIVCEKPIPPGSNHFRVTCNEVHSLMHRWRPLRRDKRPLRDRLRDKALRQGVSDIDAGQIADIEYRELEQAACSLR